MIKRIGIFIVISLFVAGNFTIAAEPVGWWKFNEASGITAYDSTAGGRNGTVNGGATLKVTAPRPSIEGTSTWRVRRATTS